MRPGVLDGANLRAEAPVDLDVDLDGASGWVAGGCGDFGAIAKKRRFPSGMTNKRASIE